MEIGYKVGGQCIYNIQPATQITKTNTMENKLYQILNERIEDYKKREDHYNKLCDYYRASEFSFKISEILSIQMLMIELSKEVENGI